MEELFFRHIQSVQDENLEALGMLISAERQAQFPYTVVQLELARRQAQKPGTWPQAWQTLQILQGQLANRTLVGGVIKSLETDQGAPGKGVILTLPLSGPYASIGWKVVGGAAAAQAELAQTGQVVSVEILNSESDSWLRRLRDLPASYKAVGGPLRVDKFKNLMASGLADERADFAFLPSLGDAAEGSQAWRFFPDPDDQIHSLLDLAASLSIYQVAILYPDESYGRRMAQLFREQALQRGMSIATSASYPPNDHTSWGGIVEQVATSGAQAVFLPGDWAHNEMLVPYFMYHGGKDLLLMGTTIWAQTLSRARFVEAHNYRRTVFPGGWWPENPAPAAEKLRNRMELEGMAEPGFWTALGYDFVRFASRLDFPTHPFTATRVNQAIQQAESMAWAMAPIDWDDTGVARQELFMFKPAEGGFDLVEGKLEKPME
jgi:hypothetical protein